MNVKSIRAYMLAVPEVAAWPEMAGIFEQAESKPFPNWNLPVLACQAVGGDVSVAIPGAAAIACLEVSIILVDDMLDKDPRGEYLRRGSGPTANLALAFQAAAFRVIEQAAVSADQRAAITASLARVALGTALAQHWDVQNLGDEENYWKVVRAKTTPLYSTALYIGALLGEASSQVGEGVRDFGVLFGEISQIRDDLFDAFRMPADPDWRQGRNSLPLLYARTADHPDRARFMDLLPQIDHPQALQAAQQILIHCGAVSYCAYHILKRYREARQLLDGLPLADPAPMIDLLAWQTRSVIKLLQTSGAEVPVDLLEVAE
jgi:geranylgeranyl pyrophosphate synthase